MRTEWRFAENQPFNQREFPAIVGAAAGNPNRAGMTVLNAVPFTTDREISVGAMFRKLKALLYRSQNVSDRPRRFGAGRSVELDDMRRIAPSNDYGAEERHQALHGS
ncbi:MAG: hypothetical protein JSR36_14040 [Proteobacteria bacterium]|nr:hypothetical protein [Pseudomonadota bacterium]